MSVSRPPGPSPQEGEPSSWTQASGLVWTPQAAIALDTVFLVALGFTLLGWGTVLSFHVCFAALTLASFAHAGRSFLIRAIPGLILVTGAVSLAVQRDEVGIDELYEIPILTFMLAFAAWSVQLHRALVKQLRAQSERLRHLHQASQIEYRDQLLLAQRLEMFGQLSAGVAHNCRNVLTTILSVAERIEDTTDDSQIQTAARLIQTSTEQGGELISDMLRHARPVESVSNADMTAIVTQELSSLAILVGPDIELEADLHPGSLIVQTSRSLIEQVLVNLVLNARDSIDGVGTIRVATRPGRLRPLEPDDLALEAAVLSVTDDGRGMTEAVRNRAFEPFFTTKQSSDGAGLGLYTSLVIAEDAGGSIQITPDHQPGTEVTVSLPLASETNDVHIHRQIDLRPEDFFGTETVLVVDDDEIIRDRLCTTLALYGYEVIDAPNPTKAIQLAGDQAIDLVVTDVIMPVMTGPEMVATLRASGFHQAVLFTSAYDNALGLLPAKADLLPKPFSRNVFLARVRRSLDTAAGQRG